MKQENQVQKCQTNTLEKYFPNVNALEISKNAKGKSIAECREGNSFTLATARKEGGIESAEKIVKQFVLVLEKQLNLSKLTPESTEAIAEDVYEMAYFLKVEEFAYFFRQLRKGTYGAMYENLNSEKVCTALAKFLDARASYYEGKNIGSHNEGTSEPDLRINENSEFRAISKGFMEKYNKK
jgi:hypothetical protein